MHAILIARRRTQRTFRGHRRRKERNRDSDDEFTVPASLLRNGLAETIRHLVARR